MQRCESVPASGQSIPHTSPRVAPAPACLRSRRGGGAVCSWPACPSCCCRPGGPSASPRAGRGCGGSGERSQEPTEARERQGKAFTQSTSQHRNVTIQFHFIHTFSLRRMLKQTHTEANAQTRAKANAR